MASVRTKIQTETDKAGAPKNLKRGEIAYNEVDGLLYIGAGPENRGQARKKLAIAGEKHEDSGVMTEDELKEALRIQGDAMGTLNTQEMFNKTIDGGLFTS